MKKLIIVFTATLIAIVSVGAYQISSLRTELEQHRADIDRLNKFVNAQAEALNSCQKVVSDLTNSVIHDNWLEMFGSVGNITTQMGLCNDAVENFNQIAATGNP